MANFNKAEKVSIEMEIDCIIGILSVNVADGDIDTPFISALYSLSGVALMLDKALWFNQLQDVYAEFLLKPSQHPHSKEVEFRLVSLWNMLSSTEKFHIASPVGKRIIYPMMDMLDAPNLDRRIKHAIDQQEIENCYDIRSILVEQERAVNYFTSNDQYDPIFQLNYNTKEGVIDFFSAHEKYESLRKFILMVIHDAVIKV